MGQRGHLNLMKPLVYYCTGYNSSDTRTFKFNETLRHIPAGEELIDRVYNVFKMICPDIIFLAKIYRI